MILYYFFFAVVGTAAVSMMTTLGITTLQCNTTATSLRDCRIKLGTCFESFVVAIACGSSVITGKVYDIYVMSSIAGLLL